MGFLGKISIGRGKRLKTDMKILTGELKAARYDKKIFEKAGKEVAEILKEQEIQLPRTKNLLELMRKIEADLNQLIVDVKYGLEGQEIALAPSRGIYASASAQRAIRKAGMRMRYSQEKAEKMIRQIKAELIYVAKIIKQEFGAQALQKGQISTIRNFALEAKKRLNLVERALETEDLRAIKSLKTKLPV